MELPKKKPIFSPNASNKAASPIAKKATPVSPKTPDVLVNKNVKGILPTTVMSKEDRNILSEEKEKKAKLACLLKNISITIGIISILVFLFMKANTSPTNAILSKIGIDNNMGINEANLNSKNSELEMEGYSLDNKIKEFKNKIEKKYYTLFSKDIKKIRESQLTWFDEKNEKGEIKLGLIDGVGHVARYFSDINYQDSNNILSGKHEKVVLDNVSANRENISFSVENTQILGKIIFMNIEFINTLNSLPIYKNGKSFSNFSREKNEDGDYTSQFSLSLDVQKNNEEDPDDKNVRFNNFKKWFNDRNTSKLANYKLDINPDKNVIPR